MVTTSDLPRVVLGTLLLGDGDARDLDPDDFTDSAHRLIHGALVKLRNDGMPASMVLVATCLEREPVKLWRDELASVMSYATTLPNLPAYVDLLRRDRRRRELRNGTLKAYQTMQDDPDQGERMLTELAREDSSRGGPTGIADVLAEIFTKPRRPGVPMGLSALTALNVGAGHLCVIGARPGVGKTAMLTTAAIDALAGGWRVMYLSLEMERKEMVERMLSAYSRVPLAEVMAGSRPDLAKASAQFNREQITVEQRLTMLAKICARIESFALAGGERSVVFLDYLQLVKPTGRYQNRVETVGEVCRELKACARRSGIPIIAGAQLSRAVEERGGERPQLSDLRESGEIEQVSDQVILIHRDGAEAKLRVAKNRHGETFTAEARFDGPCCRFEGRDEWQA